MKVLVIGNGGREHALTWKAAQSNSVKLLMPEAAVNLQNSQLLLSISLVSSMRVRSDSMASET